jgi:hypothetical protein
VGVSLPLGALEALQAIASLRG